MVEQNGFDFSFVSWSMWLMLIVIFKCPNPKIKYPRDFKIKVSPKITNAVPNTFIGKIIFYEHFMPIKSGNGKNRAPSANPMK